MESKSDPELLYRLEYHTEFVIETGTVDIVVIIKVPYGIADICLLSVAEICIVEGFTPS